eukprot:g50054.t1
MKYLTLIDDIKVRQIFWSCAGYVNAVEFQKRGLPHVHIVVWLNNRPNPTNWDDFVSAEFPDPETQPELYATCSKSYPVPFQSESHCEERAVRVQYRRLSPAEGVRQYEKGTYIYDNRNVVPYNPYLLRKYDCQINVEIVTGMGYIKYLFKYIHKGDDRARVELRRQQREEAPQRNNQPPRRHEVAQYLDAQFVTPCYAIWKIFGFKRFKKTHTVVRLDIHLPGEQRVLHNTTRQGVQNALARNARTTLTEFFHTVASSRGQTLGENSQEITEEHPTHPVNLLYLDFSTYYRWKADPRRWVRRLQHGRGRDLAVAIGRMRTVLPREGDTVYLRLLLLHQPGLASFEELRTFESQVYPTFRAACHARGLVYDDSEWDIFLEEAAETETAHTLRRLFATIIVQNADMDASTLWARQADLLSENFTYARRDPITQAIPEANHEDHQRALRAIRDILDEYSWPWHSTGLPQMPLEELLSPQNPQTPKVIREALAYDVREQAAIVERNLGRMNDDQLAIFHEINDAVFQYEQAFLSSNSNAGGSIASLRVQHARAPRQSNVFCILAMAGTGKALLAETLLAAARARRHIVLATASSGIAAIMLPGGSTAHRTFGLPVPIRENAVSSITMRSDRARLLALTSLIIWDEVVMMQHHGLSCLHRLLCEIVGLDPELAPPMAGVPVLLQGDLRQILPVIVRGTESEMIQSCIVNWQLWGQVHVRTLRINERVRQRQVQYGADSDQAHAEESYANFLESLGNGTLPDPRIPETPNDLVELPAPTALAPGSTDLDLINSVYGSLSSPDILEANFLSERIIMTPRNDVCREINDYIIGNIPAFEGHILTSNAVDMVSDAVDANLFPPEILAADKM